MSKSGEYSDFCQLHACEKRGCYFDRTGFLLGFGNVAIAAQDLIEQTDPESVAPAAETTLNADSPDLHRLVQGVDDVYRQLLETCHDYSLDDRQNHDIDSL